MVSKFERFGAVLTSLDSQTLPPRPPSQSQLGRQTFLVSSSPVTGHSITLNVFGTIPTPDFPQAASTTPRPSSAVERKYCLESPREMTLATTTSPSRNAEVTERVSEAREVTSSVLTTPELGVLRTVEPEAPRARISTVACWRVRRVTLPRTTVPTSMTEARTAECREETTEITEAPPEAEGDRVRVPATEARTVPVGER